MLNIIKYYLINICEYCENKYYMIYYNKNKDISDDNYSIIEYSIDICEQCYDENCEFCDICSEYKLQVLMKF